MVARLDLVLWRTWLKSRGMAMGPNSTVSLRAIIREPDKIRLGHHTAVGRGVELNPQGGHINLGNHCSLQNLCVLYGAGGITIEDECRIANGTKIVSFNHVFADPSVPLRQQGITSRGIHIERNVWIGLNAVILDGVRVGRNSVIGAGAVVTRSVPSGSLAVGVPARTRPLPVRP